jgi:hypothetical protein
MFDYLHGNIAKQIGPTNNGDAGAKFDAFGRWHADRLLRAKTTAACRAANINPPWGCAGNVDSERGMSALDR